jgi:hypothetical protein
LALFIAVTLYINWDKVPGGSQAIIGFAVMILALTSWVPGSFRWRDRIRAVRESRGAVSSPGNR